MTLYFDLTKNTPEQIVADLVRQCTDAADNQKLSDNVIQFNQGTTK